MFNWSINAVGEGSIWITNKNGNIDKGDLIVFDNSGEIVYLRTLSSSELIRGNHGFVWDGKSTTGDILATGVYFSIINYNNKSTRINKIAIINEE